jgi:FkbM family methyltransferase
MSYSQNQEEKYITEYFQNKVGKFIDIGAYDVFRLSNTRKLFELGWCGILIEADPTNYKSIADYYKDEPRIEVLQTAIGISSEDLVFYTSNGDAVSTSDVNHKSKWEKGGVKYNQITVPQLHIVEFLEQHSKDIDFISIDTEATNMDIFRAIPEWFWSQISMLCIEHDNETETIINRLTPFGFKELYRNAENIILGK